MKKLNFFGGTTVIIIGLLFSIGVGVFILTMLTQELPFTEKNEELVVRDQIIKQQDSLIKEMRAFRKLHTKLLLLENEVELEVTNPTLKNYMADDPTTYNKAKENHRLLYLEIFKKYKEFIGNVLTYNSRYGYITEDNLLNYSKYDPLSSTNIVEFVSYYDKDKGFQGTTSWYILYYNPLYEEYIEQPFEESCSF